MAGDDNTAIYAGWGFAAVPGFHARRRAVPDVALRCDRQRNSRAFRHNPWAPGNPARLAGPPRGDACHRDRQRVPMARWQLRGGQGTQRPRFGLFPHRPETPDWSAWRPLFNPNPQVFDRRTVKERFRLDVFFVQLDANPESLVSLSRYWLQLFSHQRETTRWKGMLRVRLGAGEMDAPARVLLDESVAEGGSP